MIKNYQAFYSIWGEYYSEPYNNAEIKKIKQNLYNK